MSNNAFVLSDSVFVILSVNAFVKSVNTLVILSVSEGSSLR